MNNDLTGQRFGRLVALARTEDRTCPRYFCRCDCGAERVVVASCLRSGDTRSCGCLRREVSGAKNLQHGMRRTRTYSIWTNMISRCTRPGSISYPNYGAKGIAVCERWMTFANFLADMGACPGRLTIERKDSTKGYELGNCRWATYKEQGNNTSTNRVVHWNGRRYTATQLAAEFGIPPKRLQRRLRDGWPLERALLVEPQRAGGW